MKHKFFITGGSGFYGINMIRKILEKGHDVVSYDLLPFEYPEADKIKQVVEKYTAQNKNVKYYLNSQNLGYSGNVFRLYELADSKYVWFLCDDDQVNTDSVDLVIKKLKEHEPVVGVFNHTQVDPYGRKIKAFNSDKDLVFTDDSQFTDATHIFRTCFLSTLVVKKLDDLPEMKQVDYQSNIFVQVTFSFLLLSREFKFVEFTDVVIHRNVGFKYGEFFKFYAIDVLKAAFLVKHAISHAKLRQWGIDEIPNALRLYLSQKLGLFKYWGRPSRETIKLLFEYYNIYALAYLSFPLISFFVPSVLLKFIYLMQLVKLYGYEKAREVYKSNINRAYTDSRKTGFTTYR